jgi:general secretion pathway protein K
VKRAQRRGEQGMALLTVLLLVAVMSVLAVSVLDDIRFGVRRTTNAAEVGQAQWYAVGAEALARNQIRRLAARSPGRTLALGGWNGRVFSVPVEGGLIRARMDDGGNCFDLNSVVIGTRENWSRFPEGVAQFRALLTALQVPASQAEAVSDALVDWIDSDTLDDAAYAGGETPYRTGGALLAEVSELRAVEGVTPQLYARLRPLVCALPRMEFPTARLSPINVNTLRSEQAVLLTMLTGGALSPEAAQAWLMRRPVQGWASGTEFLSHPALVDFPSYEPVLKQVGEGMRTRFFTLDVVATFGQAEVAMSSLLEQDDAGAVRLAARRWTPDE